ncbi:MAG: antitoxin AF2212-like protein [Anaerolineae bacterium]
MSETIIVIYEQGVLRPLLPLALPENARIQVRIVRPRARTIKASVERQHVYEALLDAGLIERHSATDPGKAVSDQEVSEAARVLGMAGPISDDIMAERAESY